MPDYHAGDILYLLQPAGNNQEIPTGTPGVVVKVGFDHFYVRFNHHPQLIYFNDRTAYQWVIKSDGGLPAGVNPKCPKARK